MEIKSSFMALKEINGLKGIEALINGILLKVFFDTGAQVSIMPLKTVKSNTLKILPTKVMIQLPDNRVVKTIGETNNLEITIGRNVSYTKFIIIDQPNEYVLLGLDWFENTGASINPSKCLINFPQKKKMNNYQSFRPKSLWLTIFFFLILLMGTNCTKEKYLDETFQMCSRSTNDIVDLHASCEIVENHQNIFDLDTWKAFGVMTPEEKLGIKSFETKERKYRVWTEFSILRKSSYSVNGYGYECSISREQAQLKTSLLGYQDLPIIESELIKIEKDRCWLLVNSKTCNGQALICDDNHCVSKKPEIKDKYGWLFTTKIFEYENCSFKKIRLTAKNEETNVLSKDCKIDDGFCELAESVAVWHPEEIRVERPFEFLSKGNFLRYSLTKGLIYIDNDQQIAFQLLKKSSMKNLTIFETTNGLFLYKGDITLQNIYNKVTNAIEVNAKLAEAQLDYTRIMQDRYHAQQTTYDCNEFYNNLDIARHTYDDKIIKIRDKLIGRKIFYVKNANIYLPICENDYAIHVEEHFTEYNDGVCFEDIPISWIKNNITGTGYLTRDKIIVKESKEIDCKTSGIFSEAYILVENGKKAIIKKKMKKGIQISLIDNLKHSVHFFDLRMKDIELHDLNFTVEYIDERKLQSILINEKKYLYTEGKEVEVKNIIWETVTEIISWLLNIWETIKTFAIIIIILLSILFLIVVALKLKQLCFSNSEKKNVFNLTNKYDADVENILLNAARDYVSSQVKEEPYSIYPNF